MSKFLTLHEEINTKYCGKLTAPYYFLPSKISSPDGQKSQEQRSQGFCSTTSKHTPAHTTEQNFPGHTRHDEKRFRDEIPCRALQFLQTSMPCSQFTYSHNQAHWQRDQDQEATSLGIALSQRFLRKPGYYTQRDLSIVLPGSSQIQSYGRPRSIGRYAWATKLWETRNVYWRLRHTWARQALHPPEQEKPSLRGVKYKAMGDEERVLETVRQALLQPMPS